MVGAPIVRRLGGAPTSTGPTRLQQPPPELRFRRRLRPGAAILELWRARPLVRALVQREFLVRYKQAVLGVAWAVLSPLALMALLSLVFERVARVDTGGAPYSVFVYLGLLPWTFFSAAAFLGGQSLLANAPLVRKVYCPREVFPLSSVIVSGIDSLVALVGLAGIFALTTTAPRLTALWIPLLLVIQLAFVVGVVLVLAAVIVYVRDLRHALPLALQLGLFATPVAYGIEAVPGRFGWIYAAVNPLAAVIDGYRRTILYGQAPDWALVGPAAVTALVVLVGGYALFKRLEAGFADTV